MKKQTAVILAAGKGTRMGASVEKQLLTLHGRPLICSSLQAFQDAEVITDIVLVTAKEQVVYYQKEIVENYGFTKVTAVVPGGAERYDSVFEGLKACPSDTEYVLIHDGARPLVTEKIIEDGLLCASAHGSAIAGMPSKDTVKIASAEGEIRKTPPREQVWIVQTPQIFRYPSILAAYTELQKTEKAGVTDDAMVMERFSGDSVFMYRASYTNIKVTTPEDIPLAELFLELS